MIFMGFFSHSEPGEAQEETRTSGFGLGVFPAVNPHGILGGIVKGKAGDFKRGEFSQPFGQITKETCEISMGEEEVGHLQTRFITVKCSARWFRRKIRCYLHESTTCSPSSKHLEKLTTHCGGSYTKNLRGKYFF
jgi:hypothetical protein